MKGDLRETGKRAGRDAGRKVVEGLHCLTIGLVSRSFKPGIK